MATPLGGGVAVLSGAVSAADTAAPDASLARPERKSPVLFFLHFHKGIRLELDELQRSAMAFATGHMADIQPLIERYHFVRSVYKHHSNAEDEVDFYKTLRFFSNIYCLFDKFLFFCCFNCVFYMHECLNCDEHTVFGLLPENAKRR